MDFRRLIGFGKTSYVMSIPKSWVVKNKLKKGDLISVEEKEGEIILSPKREKAEKLEQKETVIDITGKSMNRIKREATSAYINNFNPIILTGKDFTEKAPDIRRALGDLIAIEVMEQSSNRMVAKDFLNMDKVSINGSIRKMDMIIRSMLIDSKSIKSEQDYNSIYHRDNDVNRLNFLVWKAIRCALDDPEMLRLYNMNSCELIQCWLVTKNLEKIADNAKRIAKHLKEICLKNSDAFKKLLKAYLIVEGLYLATMKAIYSKDVHESYDITQSKKKVILQLEEFSKKNGSGSHRWLFGDAIDKMQQMVADIHEVAKSVYLLVPTNK